MRFWGGILMATQHGSCEINHHAVSHLKKQKGFQSEPKRHRSYFVFIDQQILRQIKSQLATLPKFSPKCRFNLTPLHFIGVASKRVWFFGRPFLTSFHDHPPNANWPCKTRRSGSWCFLCGRNGNTGSLLSILSHGMASIPDLVNNLSFGMSLVRWKLDNNIP